MSERVNDGVGDLFYALALTLANRSTKCATRNGMSSAALERRDLNGEHVQSVEEIGAKTVLMNHSSRSGLRRGDTRTQPPSPDRRSRVFICCSCNVDPVFTVIDPPTIRECFSGSAPGLTVKRPILVRWTLHQTFREIDQYVGR